MVKISSKIQKVVEENPLAFATIRGKRPYVIGVASCKVIGENKILITDNFMQSTVENIKKNDNIAIVAWNKKWEGYQFLGRAKYYNKGKWLNFVKLMEENKGLPAKGAILVKVSKIIKSH